MSLPRARGDQSLALKSEGYRFGEHRFARFGTDAFATRLMLRPVVFIRGVAAARFFYEGGRFERADALPRSVLHLLQDEGSVQSLHSAEHAHRKALFVDVATDTAPVVRAFREAFLRSIERWAALDRVVLHDALGELLTRAACEWAGVPLDDAEVDERAAELGSMIEGAATVGPANWAARARRRRTEEWAKRLVDDAREGRLAPPSGSALERIANHRSLDGELLSRDVAAIELLNVLRPTVAIARYIVFAAHALHMHPVWRVRFAAGDEADLDHFVDEVRRFYPFFPVVGGTATRVSHFADQRFEKGDWVLLDLFATNRDEQTWARADTFRPERFRDEHVSANMLVPQGGGHLETGHRCPGEDATIALVREGVRLLTQSIRYDVPPQDLRISLRRVPAVPESGFAMSRVRPAGAPITSPSRTVSAPLPVRGD